jgi:predicted PurR-regulated permease PerM
VDARSRACDRALRRDRDPAGALLGQAVILTLWGTLVVGLIDNLLYPIVVGKRLRLHTVAVFFAIIGGLAVFGAAGLILGPVILALTDAILEIGRRRTAGGRPAEEAS